MSGIDWTRGYSCEWRVFEVKRTTWADSSPIGGVSSIRVTRESDGDAPSMESGSMRVDSERLGEWPERYLRVAMTATQGGVSERVDVSTLLCSATGGQVDRGVDDVSLSCRSVLWPASCARLDVGTYAPKGVDGVAWSASALSEVLSAPVEATGGFTLDDNVVLPIGSTVLEAAWLVLRAGGYVLQVSGRGVVRIVPMPTEPRLSLDQAHARLLTPGVRHSLDWSKVPNRYVAIDGSEVEEAVNDDPTSGTSTVTRGYRHDVVDTHPTRVGGETLAAYCARRLEEESTLPDERTYAREWWPDVLPFDVVRATLPSVGLEGDMRVVAQSIECGSGIRVEETSRLEVRSWSRMA